MVDGVSNVYVVRFPQAGTQEVKALIASMLRDHPIPEVVLEGLSLNPADGPAVQTWLQHLAGDTRLQELMVRLSRFPSSRQAPAEPGCESVSDAYAQLGGATLRSVGIAAGLVNWLPADDAFNQRQFWEHALGVAMIARFIAEKIGADAESAYQLGMMREMGILVMYHALGDPYLDVVQRTPSIGGDLAREEQLAFGFDHIQVGAALAEEMGLSEMLVQAIRTPCIPREVPANPVAIAASIAEELIGSYSCGCSNRELLRCVPASLCEDLGLPAGYFAQYLFELKGLAAGMESVLAA